MELDKRIIKGKRPLTCFDIEEAELERWQRWQIARQVQDPSQITQQGEVK